MPYPIVKDESALAWWKSWSASEDTTTPPFPPEDDVSPDGGTINWTSIVGGLIADLEQLYDRVDGGQPNTERTETQPAARIDKELSNDRFEAKACVVIHKALPKDHALADPEFWIWIATHPGANLIRRRYPPRPNRPIPDRNNFTSTSARETFFYRLWMRAEISYDANRGDPYELADYGDVDFWRSHVFRQMFTETHSILAAFILFQHPNGPNGEKRLSQAEIRELVKHIRRVAANVMVEVLGNEEAITFVEAQWKKIQQAKLP